MGKITSQISFAYETMVKIKILKKTAQKDFFGDHVFVQNAGKTRENYFESLLFHGLVNTKLLDATFLNLQNE